MKDAGVDAGKIDEVVLVGGQTRMPRIQRLVKELFGKEGNKSVNPDEVVAVGAAIQGGVLQGEVKDMLLLDVTPLTLSIETMGGVATPMIQRNTTIPTRKTESFSTAADNQNSVEVHALQGERPMANQNRTLGKFQLTGIPPAPRGVPKIEVTFDIDANGILNVTAKDLATNRDQTIKITASSGLSKEEVERMAKEAEAHSAEDRAQREAIESKNQIDSLVYSVDKLLREQGDKISGAERGEVESAIADARKALESNDKRTMDQARDRLTQASHKLAEQMYKAAQPQGTGAAGPNAGAGATPPPGRGGQAKPDEGVVDAEYVDLDEKKTA
jgi:molecular chaperone DnaK